MKCLRQNENESLSVKTKLEIDDLKPPKMRNVLIHYEKREAPVEFASTVEEHYHQIFIPAEILHETLQAMEILLLKVFCRRFWCNIFAF